MAQCVAGLKNISGETYGHFYLSKYKEYSYWLSRSDQKPGIRPSCDPGRLLYCMSEMFLLVPLKILQGPLLFSHVNGLSVQPEVVIRNRAVKLTRLNKVKTSRYSKLENPQSIDMLCEMEPYSFSLNVLGRPTYASTSTVSFVTFQHLCFRSSSLTKMLLDLIPSSLLDSCFHLNR